jgi:hypothetical protein
VHGTHYCQYRYTEEPNRPPPHITITVFAHCNNSSGLLFVCGLLCRLGPFAFVRAPRPPLRCDRVRCAAEMSVRCGVTMFTLAAALVVIVVRAGRAPSRLPPSSTTAISPVPPPPAAAAPTPTASPPLAASGSPVATATELDEERAHTHIPDYRLKWIGTKVVSVAVSGDWTGWSTPGIPMERDENGEWAADIYLPRRCPRKNLILTGVCCYRYKFYIDTGSRQRWLHDPRQPMDKDPDGWVNNFMCKYASRCAAECSCSLTAADHTPNSDLPLSCAHGRAARMDDP